MKQIKNIFILIIAASMIVSCNKRIESQQNDPNNPTTVPASLLLGTLENDMAGMSTGSLGGINSWSAAHRWNQYHCSNYDYYDNNVYSWSSGSFDPYLVLNNVLQMEKEVLSRGGNAVNPYEAIGRFVKAYYFYNLTMLFGDVPLDDALKGTANMTPSYTTQEKVFAYVLNQLDSANTDFAALIASNDNSLSATQDFMYGGSLSSWQKLVNSYKLRVLVQLSNKSSDATLNVQAQFAKILGDASTYPIFTSQSDDFEFTYNPGGSNVYSTYPFNPSNFGSIAARYNMADTYVRTVADLKDPRVFETCEPAWALAGNDADPCKYEYFVGASTGESMGTMYNNAGSYLYSFINRKRYYSDFTGQPDVLVGYKEMCFNIAEGIERGWATGSAETWYKKGITESMAYYGIDVTKTSFTAYFLPKGNTAVTEVVGYPYTFSFDDYYAQDSVQLSTTQATALRQIVIQKYIATFENSGYEAYYNWRRTGSPEFDGGTGVGNNGVVPSRWAYPTTEQVQNATNYQAALSSQGFAFDDLNQKMWLLK